MNWSKPWKRSGKIGWDEMTNREIARTLDRIADLLQMQDENPFKIKAYRKAAHSIVHLDEDLHVYYQQDRIGDIPGVGKAVKAKIEEMIEKGSCQYYQRLISEVPEGVVDMLVIPGLGHKTVKLIYDHLGIDNLDDLLKAAEDRKIRTVPGLGGKTEYNIKKGMELLRQAGGRTTLGLALPIAEQFKTYIAESPAVTNISLVGSLRRGKPLVSDIDILVASDSFAEVKKRVKFYREIHQIVEEGEDFLAGLISFGIRFEVILVRPEIFYGALAWTTGSKEFRHRVWTDAACGDLVNLNSEEEAFQRQNLPFIPPELRENTGEIELAAQGKLPALVSHQDITGDLHIHSDWSDGGAKIQEIVDAARSLGYSYIAITDHSKSLPISGGLNEERLSLQGKVIDALNEGVENFHVFKGIEADILKDGRLDFSDQTLAELDVVIASVHSHFKLDPQQQTERIMQAIKNEHVDIIGHLTGRLLNRRSGYEIKLEPILEAAAKHRVALEINSHPDRLDVDESTARQARELGIKLAINSDAHHREDLHLIHYGVLNARRGWVTSADVLNTMDVSRLKKYLKNKGLC